MAKDILPVYRGTVVSKVSKVIGIDLDDTRWMLAPPYETAPWEPRWMKPLNFIQNHEISVWVFMVNLIVFWL